MGLVDGRMAAVTGAARGIGREDALALAREGADVAVVDVDLAGAEDTAQEIARLGRRSMAVRCDVSDSASVAMAAKQVSDELGRIDVLINNAAIVNSVALLADMDDAQWDRDLRVNLYGPFYWSRAVLPGMRERKFGRIVMMSSVAGTMGGGGQASYSASKAGLIGLAKTIAIEAARDGVTANAIVAGIVNTSAFQDFRDDMKERMTRRVAMRRTAEPREIADTIVFLASDRASYVTGQTIVVAGGLDLFTF
jgi:3-oxoacyl-[acyl-carrier protein] reductase